MRVNWFSPLPPERTGVAQFSACVVPALARIAEVRVWTSEPQWDVDFAVPVSKLPDDDAPWRILQDADINVYNIGNNRDFHARIWELSRSLPGVVILHDFCLQHLFAGHYLGQTHNSEVWLQHMSRLYHAEGYRAAQSFLSGGCSTEELAAKYPLTPLATEDALGVVVHTRDAFDRMSAMVPCPVEYAPLPYPATRGSQRKRWEDAQSRRPSGPPFRIVLCGYLGPNRRIEAIINALTDLPGHEQFRLDIYGTLWDPQAVRNLIHSAGLSKEARFHGFVEDLDSALAGADLALNLRYPSMGEASWAQLRNWDHALPSLVTRTGWYESLPEDSVLFVRPEHEVEDIQTHLRAFLAEPGKFQRIGLNGRRRLEEQHSPEQYATKLLELAVQAVEFQPRLAALKLADRVGAELGDWAGAAAAQAADAAAAAIRDVCGGGAKASPDRSGSPG
jgi:glycosyltransferase involved in cell wall biosynthesis